MSQIASAYIVHEDRIESITGLFRGGKVPAFWTALAPFEAAPKYEFSGYVIAVLISFLSERGINLPFDGSDPRAAGMEDAGLVAFSSTEQSARAVAALNKLNVSEDEMAAYFEEFTADSWPEAGPAMSAAVGFITNGMTTQIHAGGFYLLFVG